MIFIYDFKYETSKNVQVKIAAHASWEKCPEKGRNLRLRDVKTNSTVVMHIHVQTYVSVNHLASHRPINVP